MWIRHHFPAKAKLSHRVKSIPKLWKEENQQTLIPIATLHFLLQKTCYPELFPSRLLLTYTHPYQGGHPFQKVGPVLAFRTGPIRAARKATESGSRPPWVISPRTISPGTNRSVPLPLLKKGYSVCAPSRYNNSGTNFSCFSSDLYQAKKTWRHISIKLLYCYIQAQSVCRFSFQNTIVRCGWFYNVHHNLSGRSKIKNTYTYREEEGRKRRKKEKKSVTPCYLSCETERLPHSIFHGWL